MARDRPVTDDEIEALREEMREQRAAIRADLQAAGVDVSEWSTFTDTDVDREADRDAAALD